MLPLHYHVEVYTVHCSGCCKKVQEQCIWKLCKHIINHIEVRLNIHTFYRRYKWREQRTWTGRFLPTAEQTKADVLPEHISGPFISKIHISFGPGSGENLRQTYFLFWIKHLTKVEYLENLTTKNLEKSHILTWSDKMLRYAKNMRLAHCAGFWLSPWLTLVPFGSNWLSLWLLGNLSFTF